VEALKDILIHTNIEINENGLSIMEIGRERISLVSLKLKAESF